MRFPLKKSPAPAKVRVATAKNPANYGLGLCMPYSVVLRGSGCSLVRVNDKGRQVKKGATRRATSLLRGFVAGLRKSLTRHACDGLVIIGDIAFGLMRTLNCPLARPVRRIARDPLCRGRRSSWLL